MRENLQKAARGLAKIEKTLILILLPIMCITILANTLARITGLFTAQLIWAEEFARYLMIWMAFIGAALVMQEDGHYKMTAVVDALPGKLGGMVRGIAVLATIIFMIILAKVGIECCMKIAAMGQRSPTLKIPMWIPYAAIPAGMILGVLQAAMREASVLLNAMVRRRAVVSADEKEGGEVK